MSESVPLLHGHSHHHGLKNMKVYVIQFPSPFDENNTDLKEEILVIDAQKQFFKVFKTSRSIQIPVAGAEKELQPKGQHKKNLDENAIPDMVKKQVSWLYNPNPGESKISRKEFLQSVMSAVLFTIKYELNLDYTILESRDKDELFCEIFATEEWLQKKAHSIGYRLQFRPQDENDPDHLAKFPFKTVAPFAKFEIPEDFKDAVHLFKHYDIEENETNEGGSLFTYNDRVRLIRNSLNTRLDLHIMKEFEITIEDFCLHSEKPLDYLKGEWATLGKMFSAQPLDKIRNYFGEKASLYFAWMEMYKNFMVSAGIIGLIIQVFLLVGYFDETEKEWGKYLQIFFALFLAFWASFFDQVWTRKEKIFAWKWGTTSFYEEEEQRGEFKGKMHRDPVTNKMKRKRTKEWWYALSKFISYSIIFVIIVGVLIIIWTIMFFRWFLINDQMTTIGHIAGGVLNAVQIRIMNIIYDKIATLLNDWENHETETEYNNRLAIKVFVFRFFNSYASLFYLAYYADAQDCGTGTCMDYLSIQLALIFVVSILLNSIEVSVPFLLMKRRMISEDMKIAEMRKKNPELRENLYPVEKQAKFESYESPLSDYIEMIIEFGYVAIFGTALPVLPLFLLLEIVVEVRVDSWKICNVFKRADPHRSEDIGVFKDIILVMAYIGAINNAGLIIFTSGVMTDIFGQDVVYGGTEYLLSFVALEHFMLLGMFLISVIIPDEPTVVPKGLTWSERIINERLYKTGATLKMKMGKFLVGTALNEQDKAHDEDFLLTESKIRYNE